MQAQREAKEALHARADVAVPGDLLSRLRAIPFTADVPVGGGGTLTAGPGQLTVTGSLRRLVGAARARARLPRPDRPAGCAAASSAPSPRSASASPRSA